MRHKAATRMIEGGASVVAVGKINGHNDIKITMRYTHPEDSVKDALENLAKFSTINTTKVTANENFGEIARL